MTDWTEAAVDTAIRHVRQAAGDPSPSTTVRVSAATKAELLRAQQEFAAEHPGASIALDGIIAEALAARAAARS